MTRIPGCGGGGRTVGASSTGGKGGAAGGPTGLGSKLNIEMSSTDTSSGTASLLRIPEPLADEGPGDSGTAGSGAASAGTAEACASLATGLEAWFALRLEAGLALRLEAGLALRLEAGLALRLEAGLAARGGGRSATGRGIAPTRGDGPVVPCGAAFTADWAFGFSSEGEDGTRQAYASRDAQAWKNSQSHTGPAEPEFCTTDVRPGCCCFSA
jgi:hypothetical protein